jgi:hypothetical protein
MSLNYWAEQGWIEKVVTRKEDIQNLLNLAERNIDEAVDCAHHNDWKFNILYAVIINLASCALRSEGYRIKSSSGHYYDIHSLEYTLGLDSELINLLDSYRKKRNIATYELEGMVSEEEVGEIEEVVRKLFAGVKSWLKVNHPDLF